MARKSKSRSRATGLIILRIQSVGFSTSLRRAAESHEAQFLSIDLYSERNIAIVSEKSVWEGCDAQTLIGLPPGPKTDSPLLS
jgi:hypothetical protein